MKRRLEWVSCSLPADKLLQFIQSKNLSNISANCAVSLALGPTTSVTALATELLKTCCVFGSKHPNNWMQVNGRSTLLVQPDLHAFWNSWLDEGAHT